ncbi:MAG: ATP-grasp domain-containing protein [Nitrososphaera sp.]|nr:ATP-grasp domain-containing protein [Nitrososphaera sp.]
MTALLILGAGSMQVPAFYAAKKLGLRVVAIDPRTSPPGCHLADEFYRRDLGDFEYCIRAAQRHAVGGVITLAADYPVPAVATVCEALGLPGLSISAATKTINKVEMRRALVAANIPVPKWGVAASLNQANSVLAEIGAVVAKPVDSSGGRGVAFLDDSNTVDEIKLAVERAMGLSRSGEVIIEEYLEGPEVSVEAVTFRDKTEVISVTDKLTTGPPHFVEIGHSQPSQLSANDISRVKAMVFAAIRALGIANSATHTEIRLTRSGPYIIEIGARLGGGFVTSHLVPLSTGVDLVKAVIRIALGESPELKPTHYSGAAIRFLTPNPGTVSCVGGIRRARQLPGVKVVSIDVRPGDEVGLVRDAAGRIGHVICTGADALSAIKNAEKARDLISVVTDRIA